MLCTAIKHDMFLCFFSDMDYQDIEYKLVDFLNKNYYSENAPATNRMLHSQQVMLITGLIAKSKAIPESEQKYDAYKVVYFDEEGKLVETLDAKLENGKVVFTTTHLSTYGVVGYNNVVTKNPATNDMNLALILASLGLASAGAVLVSRKKLAKANR